MEKKVVEVLTALGYTEISNLKKIQQWAPVFSFESEGRAFILKSTIPREAEALKLIAWEKELAEIHVPIVTAQNKSKLFWASENKLWLTYPFISGETFSNKKSQILSAGELLGKIHASTSQVKTRLREYPWPKHDNASIQEDLLALKSLQSKNEKSVSLIKKWLKEHQEREKFLQSLKLPYVNGPWDYKANNVVYKNENQAFLIDPDNAGYLPRIFDLALALLLFNNECPTGPQRVFTKEELKIFLSAYTHFVSLSPLEKSTWQEALKFMYNEEALWCLLESDEEEWFPENNGHFLESLLALPLHIKTWTLDP